MTFSFNVSKITKNQWISVGKVAIWLLFSVLCSAVLAFVTQNPVLFGTTAPLFNLVGVGLQQLFQQEEQSAIAELPGAWQPVAEDVVVAVAPSTPSTEIAPTIEQAPVTPVQPQDGSRIVL